LAEGMEMVSGEMSLGYAKPEDFKLATRDRRFLAGLINYGNSHWASYIWDRYKGQFYLFDSMYSDREARFKKTACAWRQALVQLGMPFDFDIFGIPLTPQPEEWECGYICAAALFYNIRGLVGNNYQQVISINDEKIVSFRSTRPRPVRHQPFDLVVRDWTQGLEYDSGNRKQEREITDSVRGFLGAVILDELGVAARQYVKGGAFVKPVGHKGEYRPLKHGQKTVPQSEAFTGKGGYQLFTRFKDTNADPMAFKYRIVRKSPSMAREAYIDFPTFKKREPAVSYFDDYLPAKLVEFYEAKGVILRDGGFRVRPAGPVSPVMVDLSSSSAATLPPVSAKRVEELRGKRPVAKSAASGRVGSDGVKESQKKAKGSNGSESSLSSVSTQATPEGLVSDMKSLSVNHKKTKEVSPRAAIQGSQKVVVLPSERDQYSPVGLQGAGKEMVLYAWQLLNPPPAPSRWTYLLPKSGTYATYIPDGLIGLNQWDTITEHAVRGVVREETPVESREERYRRRNRQN